MMEMVHCSMKYGHMICSQIHGPQKVTSRAVTDQPQQPLLLLGKLTWVQELMVSITFRISGNTNRLPTHGLKTLIFPVIRVRRQLASASAIRDTLEQGKPSLLVRTVHSLQPT